MATTSAPAQSNTALIRALFDALNAHDVEAMRLSWVPEIVERFPDQTVHGPDRLAAYFQDVFTAIPDARMEIVATAEEGESVFVQWKLTGTHTGAPWQGIAVTGKRIELDGMDHFRVRDGKVVSNFVVFDQMAVGRALGLLPPDGGMADRTLKRAFNGVQALKSRVSG